MYTFIQTVCVRRPMHFAVVKSVSCISWRPWQSAPNALASFATFTSDVVVHKDDKAKMKHRNGFAAAAVNAPAQLSTKAQGANSTKTASFERILQMEGTQKETQGKLLERLRADGFENSAALVEQKIREGKWLSILAMSRDEWVHSEFNLSEPFANEIITMLGEEKKDELINFLKSRDFKGAIDQVEKLFTMNRWNVVLAMTCKEWEALGVGSHDAVKIITMLGEAKQKEFLQFLKSEASSGKLDPAVTDEINSRIQVIELMIKVLHKWPLMLTYTRDDWLKDGVPDQLTEHVVNLIKGKCNTTSKGLVLSLYAEEIAKLREAFKSPYKCRNLQSNSVILLNEYINDSFQTWLKRSDIYAPYIAMIQSSGTGKTRAVEQLSLIRWLVYVCFRKENVIGYPLASPDLVTKFLMTADVPQWRQFFSATTAIVSYLDRASKNASEAKQSESLQIPFQDCVKTAADRCFGSGFTLAKEEFFHDLVVDRDEQGKDFAGRFWRAVFELMKILENNKIDEIYTWQGETPLVFVFDEARALLPTVQANEKLSPLHRMRKSISEKNPKANCFVLLLDTSAKVANFSPPASQDSSTRVIQGEQKLLHPFVFIPEMSCFIDAFPHTLMDVIAEDYLVKLGRPMWSKGCYTTAPNIVRFASTKLGYPPSSEVNECVNFETALALFGPRTQVSLRSTAVPSDALVSSGSAILLNVSDNRHQMKIRYSSEPVLAAASFLQMANRKFVVSALEKMLRLTHTGALSAGDLGEFVTRFIAIWCWDQIVDPANLSPKPSRSISSLYSPKTVKTWLGNFVGSEEVQKMKQIFEESHDAVDSSSKFEAVLNGKILLTHFAPSFKDLGDHPKLLLHLIYQGAAGCFVNNRKATGWVLPIVVGDETTELTLDNVSYVAVQVKNQNDDIPPGKANILHHQQYKILKDHLKHPMISILFLVNGNNKDRVSCSIYNPTQDDNNGQGFLAVEVRGLTALPFNNRFGEAATLLADCASFARSKIEKDDKSQQSIDVSTAFDDIHSSEN